MIKLIKKIIGLVLILAILAVGFLYFTGALSPKDIVNLSMGQITENLKNNAMLIDVRTADEYKTAHAVGAVNLPLDEIQKGSLPDISKDKIIYVYCRTGKRATTAKELLEKAGFQHVFNLMGLDDWKALGGKVVSQ